MAKIIIITEVEDDSLLDPEHVTGVTETAFLALSDALAQEGFLVQSVEAPQ